MHFKLCRICTSRQSTAKSSLVRLYRINHVSNVVMPLWANNQEIRVDIQYERSLARSEPCKHTCQWCSILSMRKRQTRPPKPPPVYVPFMVRASMILQTHACTHTRTHACTDTLIQLLEIRVVRWNMDDPVDNPELKKLFALLVEFFPVRGRVLPCKVAVLAVGHENPLTKHSRPFELTYQMRNHSG